MKELLRLQLAGSFSLLTEVVDSASDEEWVARPYPGANLIGWSALAVETLDVPTDLERGRPARPEYHGEEPWHEVSDLHGLPAWQFMARPCVSHIRVHYGDVMGQLEAVRAKAAN